MNKDILWSHFNNRVRNRGIDKVDYGSKHSNDACVHVQLKVRRFRHITSVVWSFSSRKIRFPLMIIEKCLQTFAIKFPCSNDRNPVPTSAITILFVGCLTTVQVYKKVGPSSRYPDIHNSNVQNRHLVF